MGGIVIIGAGQAGAQVAAKARALGYSGPITLIGDEASPPYQRPPLSKDYLMGLIGAERLWLRAPEFYREQAIDLRLGTAVQAIDPAQRRVVLAGGAELAYDHLVLATGTRPRRLPAAQGGDLAGVYTLRQLADIDAMRGEFAPGRRLVILGGGYIGLEAAAVARKLGLEVSVVELAPRLLQRVAAPETSAFFTALHRGHGVQIELGTGVERILGQARASGVRLADGRDLVADFVIVGIGVVPNAELASAAGLAIDNGIATDEFGRTSDANIWAAGDCASFPHAGGRMRLESVGHAIDQAEVVAANILGAGQPYVARTWFWSDQYDCKLQIAGLNTGYTQVVVRGPEGGALSHWYYAGERLLAVDAMNDSRAYMVGKRLIEAGQSPQPDAVADLAQPLKALLG
jgi:3-phenylpropionate/trans-cinnamate dioxygenase ferredoxin reductase component